MKGSIGEQVKQCRKEKGMTLKDVSDRTSLSIGYLSQLERGLTTVSYQTIKKVANALDTDIAYFIDQPKNTKKSILKSYEKKISSIDNNRYLTYMLSDISESSQFLPRYIEILPEKEEETLELNSHDGEEFIYILEGILTLTFENQTYDLYPGDSAHFNSSQAHNCTNKTAKTVKFLVINTPNILRKE